MGWIKRYWLTLFGALPFVPALFKAAKGLVGLGGDADFIISRSQDPAWLRDMLTFLTDPPGWAIIPLILTGLGLIYWDTRRSRARPDEAPSSSARASRAAPPGPTPTRQPSRAPTAAAPLLAPAAPPPAEPDWGKLYRLQKWGDGKVSVRLRFLPDTRNQQDDAVLLVVFGYKAMAGRDQVYASTVNQETQRALHDAPNRPLIPLSSLSMTASVFERAKQPIPDYGHGPADSGFLRRVHLIRGGYYELTADGEERARTLALDLIRRA